MNQSVVIKSSKHGLVLILQPGIAFEQLLMDIEKKFHDSQRFFGQAAVAISFSGRTLTEEQQVQIIDCITANSSIQIVCILEEDEIRNQIVARKMQEEEAKYQEPKHQEPKPERLKGYFYHGNLQAKEKIESDESVIIVGDVSEGATVISKRNIVVLGRLSGNAYAGMDLACDNDSFIAAMEYEPKRVGISGIYLENHPVKKKLFSKSKRSKTPEAAMAYLTAGLINTRPLQEGLKNFL